MARSILCYQMLRWYTGIMPWIMRSSSLTVIVVLVSSIMLNIIFSGFRGVSEISSVWFVLIRRIIKVILLFCYFFDHYISVGVFFCLPNRLHDLLWQWIANFFLLGRIFRIFHSKNAAKYFVIKRTFKNK